MPFNFKKLFLFLRPTGNCYPKRGVGMAYFKAQSWHPGVSLYNGTKKFSPPKYRNTHVSCLATAALVGL